ncbi:MAG: hypothetical protein M1284_00855 [Candidatus Parvarchaeota archaeon]|jgi:hypothetical protein|nr:hypothetical protein [Candidatus Parvarchaeota archaeon]MCL5420284.1 hypothetical protein [Candidatus Parvarchaeota archaeon]
MRGNKVKGASAVEYFIVVILLISFLVIGVVIASSVFHFALLPSGIITSGNGSPAPCTVNVTNISSPSSGNTFKITVSEGSPGLTYKVYMNNINGGDPSALELVGNYSVGISSFSREFTPVDSAINTIIIGNTTGSNVSIDGVKYSAGGTCEGELAGS